MALSLSLSLVLKVIVIVNIDNDFQQCGFKVTDNVNVNDEMNWPGPQYCFNEAQEHLVRMRGLRSMQDFMVNGWH